MRPRVIVHDSLSLDGSLVGFPVDMGLHYGLAGSLEATGHLVGSGTALGGAAEVGPETEAHRRPPPEPLDDGRPQWFIVDSRGQLEGRLHAFRGTPFGRDPVVLLSERTPAPYRAWLRDRGYRHHVLGSERVDLAAALAWIRSEHGVCRLLVDSGAGLNRALFQAGLVDELSLLLMPHLVGTGRQGLLDALGVDLDLDLLGCEEVRGAVWLRYAVRAG